MNRTSSDRTAGTVAPEPRPAIEQRFSRKQVLASDYQAFVRRFDPGSSPPPQAGNELGALQLIVEGYEDDPLSACGDEETRSFLQALNRDWPHGFYYLSTAGDTLRMLAFSLLPSVVVHKRAGRKTKVGGYKRRELLHLIGDGVLKLEKSCAEAGVGFAKYRARSRALLHHFDFLK